jgi:hypothetical protein
MLRLTKTCEYHDVAGAELALRDESVVSAEASRLAGAMTSPHEHVTTHDPSLLSDCIIDDRARDRERYTALRIFRVDGKLLHAA